MESKVRTVFESYVLRSMKKMMQQPKMTKLIKKKESDVSDPEELNRFCLICSNMLEFESKAKGIKLQWLQPCQCEGAGKYIHETCLTRWVTAHQQEDPYKKVACPNCSTEFLIVNQKLNIFADALEKLELMWLKFTPSYASGIDISMIYIAAFSYGATTVMQIIGYNKAIYLMKSIPSIYLMCSLPLVPVVVSTTGILQRSLARRFQELPVIQRMFPYGTLSDNYNGDELWIAAGVNSSCFVETKVLLTYLYVPTIATIFGKTFFKSVPTTPGCRFILGGLSFLALHAISKIYLQKKRNDRCKQRQIGNWNEDTTGELELDVSIVVNVDKNATI